MPPFLTHINQSLFFAINAGPDTPAWVASAVSAAGEWPVYIAMAVLVLLFLMSNKQQRWQLITVGATVVAAIVVTWIIRDIWPHPRPFVLGLGNTLEQHAPNASFPSAHGTFMFAVCFGLRLLTPFKRVSWVMAGLALLVAWARIFVGVHFPLDMVGAFIVSGLVTITIRIAIRSFYPPLLKQA